jgi:hypothetical protein
MADPELIRNRRDARESIVDASLFLRAIQRPSERHSELP